MSTGKIYYIIFINSNIGNEAVLDASPGALIYMPAKAQDQILILLKDQTINRQKQNFRKPNPSESICTIY